MIDSQMTQAQLEALLHSTRVKVHEFAEEWLTRLEMPGCCESAAACVASAEGLVCAGDTAAEFTLMSAIKPFLQLHLLETRGPPAVAAWVGDKPSAMPYYSLRQLREDGGRPRNAMINSGAMLLSSKLAGGSPVEQQEGFLKWLHDFCPEVDLHLHEACFADVMQRDSDVTNRAIARALKSAGHVENDDDAYEIYFRLCCLAGSIVDVARLGYALSCSGSEHREQIIHTMSHSGLYEATPEWFAQTGLPAKSGVSGVMFALLPEGSCLAACDAWLDGGGNPVLPQIVLAAV